jgi:hypothetical protein
MNNSNHPAELMPFGEILSLLRQNPNLVVGQVLYFDIADFWPHQRLRKILLS